MEDQQPGSGDLTTGDDATAATGDTPEAAATKTRRGIFRRRTKPEAAEPGTSEPVNEPEPQPEDAPRTPVGKAARTPKAVAAQPDVPEAGESEADSESTDDEAARSDDAEISDSETDDSEADDVSGDDAPAEEVTLVPHRPAGKRLKVAAIAASVLFVGAGAFAGATVQPYLVERALVETKLDIAQTAADAITTLWTYTPDDMNTLADRASRFLGGNFADEYRQYIDAIVEPNKQAQVTNTTEVMGAAVETVAPPGTPDEATAIVYTNSVATSPVTKNIPSLRYLSYRLTMQRDGARWLITRMSTVTSFDLTPQL